MSYCVHGNGGFCVQCTIEYASGQIKEEIKELTERVKQKPPRKRNVMAALVVAALILNTACLLYLIYKL